MSVSQCLSKVPACLSTGQDYGFPSHICVKLKTRFPHLTPSLITELATRLGSFRDMNEMFEGFVPEHPSDADDGKTGKELRAILSSAENLLKLMQSANSRTKYLLEQAYTVQEKAPGGICHKHFPDIEDVRVILSCLTHTIKTSPETVNLLKTGRGRRRGSANGAPYSILDLLSEVICQNYQTDGTGQRVHKNDNNLSQKEALDLVKILEIDITEYYVKRWRGLVR